MGSVRWACVCFLCAVIFGAIIAVGAVYNTAVDLGACQVRKAQLEIIVTKSLPRFSVMPKRGN